MLILNRLEGQSVLIDGGIRIKVIQVDGDRVRLGIEAPRSVVVLREEVKDRRISNGGK